MYSRLFTLFCSYTVLLQVNHRFFLILGQRITITDYEIVFIVVSINQIRNGSIRKYLYPTTFPQSNVICIGFNVFYQAFYTIASLMLSFQFSFKYITERLSKSLQKIVSSGAVHFHKVKAIGGNSDIPPHESS